VAEHATNRSADRGRDARREILFAALRVVGSEVMSASSLGAIAREAGTSKAALLYHFESREKLLHAMAGQALDHFHETVFQAARASEDGVSPTRASLSALFSPSNRPMLAAVHELLSLGIHYPLVGLAVRNSFERMARMVASLLGTSDEETYRAAHSLVIAVQGHIELWICSGEEDPTTFIEGALLAVEAIIGSLATSTPSATTDS
jgi:AcrR family transcriptional regulator